MSEARPRGANEILRRITYECGTDGPDRERIRGWCVDLLHEFDALRAELASVKEMHARILGWPPQDVVNADATLSMAAATMARRDHGSGKALLGALDAIKRHRRQQDAEIDALRRDRDEAVALLGRCRPLLTHDGHARSLTGRIDEYLGRPR